LYNNRLTAIGPNIFAGLTSLQGLAVYSNEISVIADTAFQGLISLLNL
jgi:hypothetical protein